MTSVAKLELNSITDFQKEIHESKMIKNSEGEDVLEEISSIFYREFQKSTWYTRIHTKMPCTVMDDDTYVFRANTTFHYLMYSYIAQQYPYVSVKPEFRGQYKICWPHNLAINTINYGRFEVDDTPYNSLDNVWLDKYFEHFMKPGFREHHNMCVGNVPPLEEWSDVLRPYKTSLHQPWFYSQDPGLAFPLYFCSKDTSVSHVYEMKTFVSDLLRMVRCVEKNGEKVWVEMKDVDFSVLDGVTVRTALKKPEMWAAYAYVTKNEIEWNTKCNDSQQKVFYINDIVACDQTNTETYGKSVEVDLFCETPCKSIFWAAENMDAKKKRNFSNYTTDSTDIYRGWNPIEHVSLKYGKNPRIKQMETYHFSRMQPWYHFPSPPHVAGHNVYTLADDPMSMDAEVGLVLSKLKAKMFFKLKNPEHFQESKPHCELESETTADEEEYIDSHVSYVDDISESKYTSPNFRMRVRLLITKKMVIEKKGDKYEFSI